MNYEITTYPKTKRDLKKKQSTKNYDNGSYVLKTNK